ncbi:unnamed protein product, partial [Musa hybrid cultivar]
PTALNLKKKVDILSSTNAKGIIHNIRKNQPKLIFQYLRREIGYKPTIYCNT